MDFLEDMATYIASFMLCGFVVPIYYLVKSIPIDQKAIKVIVPYVLIGFAGVLYLNAYWNEKPALYFVAWIVTICVLFYRYNERKRDKERSDRERAVIDRKNALIAMYNECIQNEIHDCASEKNRQRASLIANKHNLTYTNIGTLYQEAKQLYQGNSQIVAKQEQQKEIEELRTKEQAQYNVLNEFSFCRQREKKIAMLTKEYNEISRQLQGTNYAISMALSPQLEKEHDWAVLGGMANGLAGPGAGIATAVNAQIENAQIRARNNQILRDTADMRGRMVLAGARQCDALQARCSELNAMITATKTKLIGNDTPRQCLDALQFDDTLLSVSKTGTCMVDAKVSLKQSAYYIFDDVKATIDGTIQAEIYDGNSRIGTAKLVLPLNGVPNNNMVAVKGMCLFCGQPGKHYSVKFNAENLWAMEQ